VRAESAGPGLGSRFVVELPVAPAARGGADAQAAGQGEDAMRALRILLADDNLDAVELLREALELDGHTVHAVGNGADALEAAAWFAPDVACVDIGMPGLNGDEVARRLRALPAARGALLVAVTGWGAMDGRDESSAAGFDHHLTKPVDLSTLRQVVAVRRKPAR
jgi:CheY-like chemotaxis protein